jgi:GTPase
MKNDRMVVKAANTTDAALVTLNDDIAELEELASSAGYRIVFETLQRRKHPSASTFVGKGKLEELKELLEAHPVKDLLINGDLKPSQHYLLENELKVEIIDRVRLVLNIFSTRAFSREAQLQVLRAKLLYEIPLLREWIHNSKGAEHPGFLGGGEYETDSYYEMIRRQISKINEELAKLVVEKELRRKQRKKRGFYAVTLAGYTNAGKSSLLNTLTGEKALVEDRMFSTLSTTTGKLEGINKQILLTDTIGFLRDLPHFLIESFKSTIDEIYTADLVLLVLDSSDQDEEFLRKLETSVQIIFPEVDATNLIVVLSKTDKAFNIAQKLHLIAEKIPCRQVIKVSSLSRDGVDKLHDTIAQTFRYPCEMRFQVPQSTAVDSLISWLYDNTEVSEVSYGDRVTISIHCRDKDHAPIVRRIVDLGGTPISDEGVV